MKFSLDVPVKDMPQKALNIVLYEMKMARRANVDFMKLPLTDKYMRQNMKNSQHAQKMVVGGNSDSMRSGWKNLWNWKPVPPARRATKKGKPVFRVDGKNISTLSEMGLDKLIEWFNGIEKRLSEKQNAIARDVLKEIRERLQFRFDVGLTTLHSNRLPVHWAVVNHSDTTCNADWLAAPGNTYILDEPSIGLHQRIIIVW